MIPEITQSFGRSLDYLARLVADVDDGQMSAQPGGAVNHPAWVIGHLIYSCQAMCGELGVAPWLPEDWADRFGTGSRPLADRAAYPSKDALVDGLLDGRQRLVAAPAALSDEDLATPLPDERYRHLFPTLGHAVVHILGAHTAVHVGQITVWRRSIGLAPLGEPFV